MCEERVCVIFSSLSGARLIRRSHAITYAGTMAIDPIQLTTQLVNIESTTYCEGPAGVFLHEYLRSQRYAVERMPVAQPNRARTPGAGSGERFKLYAALPVITPAVELSPPMEPVPPFIRPCC